MEQFLTWITKFNKVHVLSPKVHVYEIDCNNWNGLYPKGTLKLLMIEAMYCCKDLKELEYTLLFVEVSKLLEVL